MLLGFFLVFIGMLVDLSDNFPDLGKYFILGKTLYQSIFERFFGYLLGFFFIAVGLKKWMPTVVKLKEFQRELEKKVRERTDHLLSEIAQRKSIEERLRASLEERNILLKEVHHRVKNNLQIVLSLIGMRLRTVKNTTSRAVLEDLQQRIMAISMIHESLYRSENITSIYTGSYIRNLLYNLHMSYGGDISIHHDIDNVSLSIDIAIPIGIILSELILNALKHAFPHRNGGNIYVSFKDLGTEIFLEVRDDGVGFKGKVRGEKLGLKLIGMLLEQFNGSMQMEEKKGACFKIRIPKVYNVIKGA